MVQSQTPTLRQPKTRLLGGGWRVVLLIIALFALLYLVATLLTPYSQLARTIAWLQSDVGDYRRFPQRVVNNAPPVFQFQDPSPDDLERYAPLFTTVPMIGDIDENQTWPNFLARTDTTSFLVIKDDVLLYEWYGNGYERNSTVTSFSTAKSFVSALIGFAIADGYIGSVEDPITDYLPELMTKDPRFAQITIRHLLTMSSGIHYEEHGLPWSDDATTYYAPDLREVALSCEIAGPPGQTFLYNNFHPLLLGLILERATGQSVSAYLEEKIWRPLGMEASGSWSLDSETSGFEKMESGINGQAIDFAKFARLFLYQGNWNGQQLLPATWVEESTRRDTTTDPADDYQYLWWVSPSDEETVHFSARGKHGQHLFVFPDQQVIIVRFGTSDPFYPRWVELYTSLAQQLEATEK